MANTINTNGLLFKGTFNTQSISTPQFVYKTAANVYITLADIYISAPPGFSCEINLYLTKQVLAPNPYDLILANTNINNYNGTIVLNNVEMTFSESIFISCIPVTGNINVQVRGRSQVIPPNLLLIENI